ncbi:g9370 [Coccomyxa elongata]
MALAFLGFMAEGVVTSILFRSKDGQDRVHAIQRHLLIQAFAFLCLLGGFYAIYQNKVVHGKEHFKSVHGKFGLATFILGIVAPLGGLISFRRLGLLQKFPDKMQPRIKWAHRNIGILTWLLALVTIQLALTHHAVWKGWVTRVWQLAVVLLGALVVGLAWLQPRARPMPAGADFELVMEPTQKHTPDLPRTQAD